MSSRTPPENPRGRVVERDGRPPPPLPPIDGRAENGAERCREPYLVNGQVVAYCERWFKPVRSRWRHPRRTHRGPHRFEWWSGDGQ